jgi:peptidyl-prolyl cis-trans isomerase D
MLITALAFVGLMVFQWGMDLSGRSSANAGGHLGSVNGEPITAEQYQSTYRTLYQQQQEQLGDRAITSAQNREIEEMAWEQLVNGRLIEQEMRRRNISVSRDEILQAAQFAPPPDLMSNELFLTDGQFDLQKYQAFLQQPLDDQTLLQLEAYYRDVIPRSKLYFQNTAGIFLSDAHLWRMWRDVNESASIRFVRWDPETLVEDSALDVTTTAIREYYEAHEESFTRPARATVKYLVVPRVPDPQDSAAALAVVRQARTRLAAGESFEQVASSIATDTMEVSQRTALQVIRNAGVLPPAFEQAAFTAPLGQLSEPLLTPYGYHVLRVDSRSGDTATVRQVLVRLDIAEDREDALLERADSIESFAEEMALEEIGRRMNLPVQTIDLAPPLAVIPGVADADEGIDWALREGEPREVSELFEAPNAFYMLELVRRTEEGVLSLEEATPAIRPLLLQQQRIARAREQLQPAVAAVRQGTPLREIATRYNGALQEAGPFTRGDVVPGVGQFNAVVGAAFGLQPGQFSDLVQANNQLYLVQTVARTDADRAEWQKQLPDQRQRVRTALADERWQQYLRGLRERAEIVDNRAELRRQQQLAGQP